MVKLAACGGSGPGGRCSPFRVAQLNRRHGGNKAQPTSPARPGRGPQRARSPTPLPPRPQPAGDPPDHPDGLPRRRPDRHLTGRRPHRPRAAPAPGRTGPGPHRPRAAPAPGRTGPGPPALTLRVAGVARPAPRVSQSVHHSPSPASPCRPAVRCGAAGRGAAAGAAASPVRAWTSPSLLSRYRWRGGLPARAAFLPARLHQPTVGKPDQDRVRRPGLQPGLPGEVIAVPPVRWRRGERRESAAGSQLSVTSSG